MENNRYGNINELISEIEALGDWKDVSQRENFFRVLSKITVLYNGYEIKNKNGETTKGYYPEEVFEAIVTACKGKFPTEEQVFDEQGELKPGCPEYSNYLVLVNDYSSISLMCERTRINQIARDEFEIDVYHTPSTREEVDGLINSSKDFLEKDKVVENNRYGNINELISEIEALGDWKDVSQRENFFRVLSKITVLYNGYEIKNKNGETTKGYYPEEVFEAIVTACKGKFPTEEQVFDEQGELKPGCPEYSNYLVLVNDYSGISLMGERTRINQIARDEFGIDVYHTSATREEVDGLISSSKDFLEKKKEQELEGSGTSSERTEKETSIRKSQAEKQAIEQQIAEIDKEIEDLTAALNQKKAERDALANSLEDK